MNKKAVSRAQFFLYSSLVSQSNRALIMSEFCSFDHGDLESSKTVMTYLRIQRHSHHSHEPQDQLAGPSLYGTIFQLMGLERTLP